LLDRQTKGLDLLGHGNLDGHRFFVIPAKLKASDRLQDRPPGAEDQRLKMISPGTAGNASSLQVIEIVGDRVERLGIGGILSFPLVVPAVIRQERPPSIPVLVTEFADQSDTRVPGEGNEGLKPSWPDDPTLFLKQQVDLTARLRAPACFPRPDVESRVLAMDNVDSGIPFRQVQPDRSCLIDDDPNPEWTARSNVQDLVKQRKKLIRWPGIVVGNDDQNVSLQTRHRVLLCKESLLRPRQSRPAIMQSNSPAVNPSNLLGSSSRSSLSGECGKFIARSGPGSAQAELSAEIKLTEKNHFALEMDHMAERIARNERPHTPGEAGLQDLRLIEAIYRAAREG